MQGKPLSKNYVPKEFTSDVFEYESSGKAISVVGHLKEHIGFWKSIGCSDYVLDVIDRGCVIPIQGEVDCVFHKSNRSSRDEPEFCRTAIEELLENKAVVEVREPPFVVNPLSVSIKNYKKRLVIDLRHFNKAVVSTKCKYEGIDTALQQGGYMTAFDLKA